MRPFLFVARRADQLKMAGIASQPRTVDVRERRHASVSMSHFGNRLSTSSSAIRPSRQAGERQGRSVHLVRRSDARRACDGR